MKEFRPDDERLSALLNRRLTGRERDELLAHLADHDEDYQVFVDTADILHEAEAEDAPGEVKGTGRVGTRILPWPGAGRHRRTHGSPRPIALAAVVVGLVVLGALALRGRAATVGSPVRLAARLEHSGQGLPERWTERRPWTTARGGADGPPAVQAAQAGALLVDLSVAAAARDSMGTWLLATQLWRRFDPQAPPSSPLRRIAANAGEPYTALRPLLKQATKRLEQRPGGDYLRLGAWAEAAGVAAQRRDEAFFRSGDTRRMLRRAERLTADGSARAAVSRVRAALAGQGQPDWNGLAAALDTLLREVAS